jgi:hypothetical protein
MANVSRLLATWQGFPGAPGYSRFSFEEITSSGQADLAGGYLRTFFNALAGMMHTNWTITVNSLVENFDLQTGKLTSQVVMANPPAPISGTGLATTPYTGGTGVLVQWLTGVIFNGRRVRGRTFLVPLVGVGDTDGTINATNLATVRSAAQALADATGPSLTVWSKIYNPGPPPIQVGGTNAPVDTALVNDKTGILRSRRD